MVNISTRAKRHVQIKNEIMEKHPEIKEMFHAYPGSLLYLLAWLAFHWTCIYLVKDLPLYLVFLIAFTIGQVVMHGAGSLLHDAVHDLFFEGPFMSDFAMWVQEIFMTSFGEVLTYKAKHVTSHHPGLGDYDSDYEFADVCLVFGKRHMFDRHPTLWFLELLIHLLPLGFFVDDLIGSLFFAKDKKREELKGARMRQRLFFIATSVGVLALLYYLWGPNAVLYQLWSLSLFNGFWGVTRQGQSVSEHNDCSDIQPTNSDYRWWVNLLFFNTGYHSEHHTFAKIPWIYLPKVKKLAPEYFCYESKDNYVVAWWKWVRSYPRQQYRKKNDAFTEATFEARCVKKTK